MLCVCTACRFGSAPGYLWRSCAATRMSCPRAQLSRCGLCAHSVHSCVLVDSTRCVLRYTSLYSILRPSLPSPRFPEPNSQARLSAQTLGVSDSVLGLAPVWESRVAGRICSLQLRPTPMSPIVACAQLGCGTGIVGLACVRLGAVCVCATDTAASVLEQCRVNFARGPPGRPLSVAKFDWGDPDTGVRNVRAAVDETGVIDKYAVCVYVCFIASQLHATAVIWYPHAHTYTHRHTQTHTDTQKQSLFVFLIASQHTLNQLRRQQ